MKALITYNVMIKSPQTVNCPDGLKPIAGHKESVIEYATEKQMRYLLTLEARKMFPDKIRYNDFVSIVVLNTKPL